MEVIIIILVTAASSEIRLDKMMLLGLVITGMRLEVIPVYLGRLPSQAGDSGIVAENDGVTLLIDTPNDAIVEVFKSQENPPLGWVSRRFDVKVPATTVVVRSRIHGTPC